jgi:extracellular matrix regulatory protein A
MSKNRLINIGFSNVVMTSRIVCVLQSESAAAKRLRQESKVSGKLIDGTQGRKTRSLVLMDTDHLILSSLRTESIQKRIEMGDTIVPEEEELEENGQ